MLGQDADFTTVDILHRDRDGSFGTQFRQTSEELRLAGDAGRLNWLIGAFHADENLDSRNQLAFGSQFQQYFSRLLGNPALLGALTGLGGSAFPGGQGQRDVFDHESESWALFTNNAFALTEAFELTVGLRYTSESKDLRSRYFNDGGGAGCQALRNRLLTAVVPSVPAATSATTHSPRPSR